MKTIIAVALFIILLGCDHTVEKKVVVTDKKTNYTFRVICMDGVEYYAGHRALAPRYQINGNLCACD